MFTPTIVKVLKYLKDTKAKKTDVELATIIDEEQQYVNKALERLVAIDVVMKEGGFYLYKAAPHSEEFSARLAEVYETVSRKPAKELFIRGLICHIPPQYLFHVDTLLEMLEQEGFEREELRQFLQQEYERGYLRIVKLIYIGVEPQATPICIPPFYFYYLRHLGLVDHGGYKRFLREYKDYEFNEQDYLVAQYPPELAAPAKEYIERERKEIKESLRRKGLQAWKDGLMRFYYW